MIDAETGSGKTAAVLSAALSRKEPKEKIVIFTKMLGQMDAWFRELGMINEYQRKIDKQRFTMVPLVGKSHLCPLVNQKTKKLFTQIGCSLFDCSHNSAYYVLKSNYENDKTFPMRILEEITENLKKGVGLAEILWLLETKINTFGCPYLATKLAMKQADITITTYPFLLNTKLREKLIEELDLDLANTTIIIDEAHNLAKGNCGQLSYKVVYRALNEIGHHPILDELMKYKEKPGLHNLNFDEHLLTDLRSKGKDFLLEQYQRGAQEISYTLLTHEFIEKLDVCYLTADKNFTLYLKDPRTILNPMKHMKQLILLSGTFRPLTHFADFLGISQAKKITVLSDKLSRNRLILTTSDEKLSMKYKKRSRERFLYYGEVIKQLTEVIPGHCLVFAPNYALTSVLANVIGTPLVEQPNQSIGRLLSIVKDATEKIVLVAPSRGKISEGIEFVKNDKSLISAVIIAGLPFPPPSRSLKEIIVEYSKYWGEYRATNYMNYLQAIVTMRQALGRMIRSENDVGAWIILDNRLSYMDIFPKAIECKDTAKMIERLKFFYKQHSK